MAGSEKTPPYGELPDDIAELMNEPEFQAFFNDSGDHDNEDKEKEQIRIGLMRLLRQRYLYVYIYDKANEAKLPGRFVRHFTLSTGFLVLEFKYCFAITPGDKTFAEYGNWGRAINSIEELLLENVAGLNYQQVMSFSNIDELEAAAWAICQHKGKGKLPVANFPPNDHGDVVLWRLQQSEKETKAARPSPRN